MAPPALLRHLMPAVTAATFLAVALPALPRTGPAALAPGALLVALHWLVEWRGIAGSFEGKVPRHPLVTGSRALWLAGFVVALVDAFHAHWTPWQGAGVRAAGVAAALAGIGLRLWSMRTLARSFTYDLRVSADQELVRRGPYRVLRHPSYTGMLLWSLSLGLWNPSAPGLAVLAVGAAVQLVVRIGYEERLLAAHFGERWTDHARATWRLVPGLW
jgi:protein-S-isoprenylcysteine O-methyltransferase